MDDLLKPPDKIDVKILWEHENHFTHWLVAGDNIRLLSNAIGKEIIVNSIQQQIGNRFIDILAKDSLENFIIIENQFTKTDHNHLDKILTYAAGFQAKTCIWIATKISSRYVELFDWLNQSTDESYSFYLIQLEVRSDAGSNLFPVFKIISAPAPSEASKKQANKQPNKSTKLTNTKRIQNDFWHEFRQALNAAGIHTAAQPPGPYYVLPTLDCGAIQKARIDVVGRNASVDLYFPNITPELLNYLKNKLEIIDRAFITKASPVTVGFKSNQLWISKREVYFNKRDEWNLYIKWFIDVILQIPRIIGGLYNDYYQLSSNQHFLKD